MAGKAQQKKHKKIKDEISNVLTLPNRQTLTEMMVEVVSRSKTGQLKSGDLAFYSQFQKIKVLYLKLSEEIEYLKTLHKQTSVSNDDGPTPETVAKIQTPAMNDLQRRWGGRKTNISERIKEALALYCEVVKR